jgi:hypothetical protein
VRSAGSRKHLISGCRAQDVARRRHLRTSPTARREPVWSAFVRGLRTEPGARGWFILKALGVLLVLTIAGLLLDALGLDAGGYLVLGVVGAFVIVMYVLPWWPTGGRRAARRERE